MIMRLLVMAPHLQGQTGHVQAAWIAFGESASVALLLLGTPATKNRTKGLR